MEEEESFSQLLLSDDIDFTVPPTPHNSLASSTTSSIHLDGPANYDPLVDFTPNIVPTSSLTPQTSPLLNPFVSLDEEEISRIYNNSINNMKDFALSDDDLEMGETSQEEKSYQQLDEDEGTIEFELKDKIGKEIMTEDFNKLFGEFGYHPNRSEIISEINNIADLDDDEVEQEDIDFMQSYKEAAGFGKQKKRKIKPLSDKIRNMLGAANVHYINKDYQEAIAVLKNVIMENPNVHQAWFTLGMIHDEMEEPTKAIHLYLVAAHLTPEDADLWRKLAVTSLEFDAYAQAIYCYDKASKADPLDYDSCWDKTILLIQQGEYGRAITSFMYLNKHLPYNKYVVKELASLYVKQLNHWKAALLYKDAIEYFINGGEFIPYKPPHIREELEELGDDHAEVIGHLDLKEDDAHLFSDLPFDYMDVNIMAELCFISDNYEIALNTIIKAIAYIKGMLKDSKDSIDMGIKSDFISNEKDSIDKIPLELRVKMGIGRLMTGDIFMAKRHFEILFNFPVSEYAELYYEVADQYMKANKYEEAIQTFEMLLEEPEISSYHCQLSIGKCYHHLQQYDEALKFYRKALKEDPGNKEATIGIAEIFEKEGDKTKALEFFRQAEQTGNIDVIIPRNGNRLPGMNFRSIVDKGKSRDAKYSFFDEQQESKIGTFGRSHLIEERIKLEIEREKVMKLRLHILSLAEAMQGENAKEIYTEALKAVLNIFQTTPEFYPSIRNRKFKGFKFLKFKNESGESEVGSEVVPTSYMGYTFDEWLDLHIKCAHCLVDIGMEKDAFDLLKAASLANIFYNDKVKRRYILGYTLSLAYMCRNFEPAGYFFRVMFHEFPFKNHIYRFFCAVCSGPTESTATFASSYNQKYFLRHLLFYEQCLMQQQQTGESTQITKKSLANAFTVASQLFENNALEDMRGIEDEYVIDDDVNEKSLPYSMFSNLEITGRNPVLLSLYGHMLLSARTYYQALLNYLRAYEVSPHDPIINLCLGLSYIFRGMQRKTDNRHYYITQGLFFIRQYQQLRGDTQETNYNLGRAFHHLGLLQYAVLYYERVFELPSQYQLSEKIPMNNNEEESHDPSDLKHEAAYNLSLIYSWTGSERLAHEVLRRYCTI